MLKVLRATTASIVAFALVVAATGWLYVVQPHFALPGPSVADARPLDELSRRSAVPMIVFLAVLLPDQRHALIGALAPERVHGVSTALVAPLGFVLLVVARGLARRKRRAWQIAVGVLCTLVFLHLQHRFGYGAIATGLVTIALLARRSDFDAPGDPESHPRIAVRALLFASG